MNFIKNFARDESGASAAEYALILVVVGVAIVGAAGLLSDAISGAMSDTATIIENGQTGGGTDGAGTDGAGTDGAGTDGAGTDGA